LMRYRVLQKKIVPAGDPSLVLEYDLIDEMGHISFHVVDTGYVEHMEMATLVDKSRMSSPLGNPGDLPLIQEDPPERTVFAYLRAYVQLYLEVVDYAEPKYGIALGYLGHNRTYRVYPQRERILREFHVNQQVFLQYFNNPVVSGPVREEITLNPRFERGLCG